MMQDQITESIANIRDGDEFFQVLNEAGDDWDEAATRLEYEAWIKDRS